MALYAIGDLHLSLSSNKPMDVFGEAWKNYVQRLEESFSHLHEDDVTVLCGDLSWGMSLEESLEDFRFIDRIPGKKILLKGNHDYWWTTVAKMERFFDAHGLHSMQILHNNCLTYGDYALCGTRGWFYELDHHGTHNEKVLLRDASIYSTRTLSKYQSRLTSRPIYKYPIEKRRNSECDRHPNGSNRAGNGKG